MKFESFGKKPNQENTEETVDQSKRDFLHQAGGLATGAALTAAGMMPDSAEAFGSALSPEDFKKEYLDNLEVPLHLGNPATIKKQLADTYQNLSPMQRSVYVMAMPSNCSEKTVLKSYNPSNGSIEVVCKR